MSLSKKLRIAGLTGLLLSPLVQADFSIPGFELVHTVPVDTALGTDDLRQPGPMLLRLITWIGRWSMLDLFVISLTMSLINRDQLLAFTMGPAAVYFGGAVILTILAVEWLDSRLLWDAHESGNARFAD